MPSFNFTSEELHKSAQKFLPELFIVPMIAAEATLKHLTPHLNLQGDLVLGQLTGDMQLAPYKKTRGDSNEADLTIEARKLAMHLGNCADKFDPHEVWGSIYSDKVLRGENLKNVNIAKAVLTFAAAALGRNLNKSIWSAKSNPSGDTTADLFDGFDTITAAEIKAQKITTGKHNYKEVAAITNLNGVEIIESIMDDLSPELISTPCKLYASPDIITSYERDYRERYNASPYNKRYEKYVVEGTAGMVELVPLASKAGSQYIHIAPKGNMHYGTGGGHFPQETIGIGKYGSWMLTFEAAMAFGVQFKSLSPEELFVAKVGLGA